MRVSALTANLLVSLSPDENRTQILRALEASRAGDTVLFPEGMISGYSEDMSFIKSLDFEAIAQTHEALQKEARERQIRILAGSITFENGALFNVTQLFEPSGKMLTYRKVNLANVERGVFTAGDQFPIFDSHQGFRFAIQMCREVRFPEQWEVLGRKGADIIFHLNNAVGDSRIYDIWKSHLISRAAENQRFVVSVNNADIAQKCPTVVVDPHGFVLSEISSSEAVYTRTELDLSLIANDLRPQSRTDLTK